MLLATVLLYFGGLLNYSVPWQTNRVAGNVQTLKVMTYNRGQAQGTSLQPFKLETAPDILALQDAGRRVAAYQNAEGYREFTHAEGVGEFVLLSKHPIVGKKLLAFSPAQDAQAAIPVAARFEVAVGGRNVAVYIVHLPTPRPVLMAERGGGFLWGILGIPGTKWAEKRRSRQKYWDGQIELARQLDRVVREEKLPCIVMGDFNSPAMGTVYRMFSSHLQDTHRAAGSGYGYTFPGVTRNPLSFFKPWLRLDHIYSDGRNLVATGHKTEPDRGSQHRAVFAELAFSP